MIFAAGVNPILTSKVDDLFSFFSDRPQYTGYPLASSPRQ